MIFIDELEWMKLYKKPFHLPIIPDNKRKGSLVYLLTPNIESTVNILSNPLLINKKYFQSYYIEKDITYYINDENMISESNIELLSEGKKDKIKDKCYGLPSKKKYPMYDDKHVLLAIRFFNYVDSKDEKELAENINKNIKKFKLNPKIGDKNRFKKYYHENSNAIDYDKEYEDALKELEIDFERVLINEDIQIPISENSKIEDYSYIDEEYMRCKVDNNDVLFVFNENLEDDAKKHSKFLYKILYKERLRNNKQVFAIYNDIKDQFPWITKTNINIKRYKGRNLIVDLSFYNKTFFKNNIYKLDKGINLYFDFINRFIKDKRFTNEGYSKRTVLVPINDWYKSDADIYKYNSDINPISMIYRLAYKRPELLKKWEGITFIFINNKGYFKCDLSNLDKKKIGKFKMFIDRLLSKDAIPDDDIQDNSESKNAIVANIIDKIEDSQKIKINNLTGSDSEITKDELKEKIDNAEMKSSDKIIKNKDEIEAEKKNKQLENDKKELVDTIKNVAKISKNTDDAINNLENDEKIKNIINKLASEEDDTVKINAARASRITKLQNEFLDKTINNTTVRDMIINANTDKPLPKTEIKVDSVNEEWNNMQYMNFEKVYDPNDDIVEMISDLSRKTVPVMARNIELEDTSTSEDYVKTYKVQLEDYQGSRFSIKFDIPDLIDNKFLKLRGNKKTISGQLIQIPIVKTDVDTVQIISNYNKIFIRRFGTTSGKSFPTTDRLIKAIEKSDQLKITYGDNSKICDGYELPIDYIDLSSMYNKVENKNYVFLFNQDEVKEKYKVDYNIGVPIAYDKKDKKIIYYTGDFNTCSDQIYSMLSENDPQFKATFLSTNLATRYTYSKASILNTTIPLIVIMGYSEGLVKSMNKAHIKFELTEKRKYNKNDGYDVIKFKDGYLSYKLDYNSSLLMNGLKECNTEDYSLENINDRSMFLNFLEIFGTRILADGLDNFYDLMIDPITREVLQKYKLPTDYIEILAYANMLLADNKFIKHTDMSGRRYRSNEIIAGYAYKAISESYGDYKNQVKRTGKGTMTMKQSSVIDKILLDPTASDVSVLNDLLLLENINSVSFKGLSGMNTDRSYSLDKRTYDKSMLNILGLSTGFAGNVGITRQATLDMNVESKRGYLKVTEDPDKLSITKTFTATEALTPFGTTRDDPFRSAMTFIQTSKHGMRIKHGMPSLISNGADQALPYLTPNIFSFKAKMDGTITEKTDDYMIIKYKDGSSDFVDLRDKVEKNSNGGFYTSIKLDSDLKKGSKVKAHDIVAYDKLSYSNIVGDQKNIAYNLGVLSKVAILNTDEGYEDSAIISEWMSEAMASEVIDKKDVNLPKNCNVLSIVKKGQKIQEGDPLIIFQNAFDDEDVNILLKNLADNEEDISDLGRIPIKSHVTGIVQDIVITRTVDKEDLSPSLKKIVNDYERPIANLKKVMTKNNIEGANRLEADYKLDAIGKLKNVQDGILIEFYLKYDDKMSVGDKLINYSALKGVVKEIFPKGLEPRSEFRPDEKIHSLLSRESVDGRMVCSVMINLGINKVLIELDRAVKDILGIPWKYLDGEKPKKK